MAITGERAAVFISGTPIAFTNEAMGTTDNTTYTISNALKSVWNINFVTTFQVSTDGGTTWVAPSVAYKVVSLLGKVIFSSALAPGTLVRASGQYVTLSIVGDAKSWDLTIDRDMLESTRFRSGWKTQVPALKGGTASFERWWIDSYFTHTAMTSELIFNFYLDDTSGYRANGHVSNSNPSSSLNEIVSENISISLNEVVRF